MRAQIEAVGSEPHRTFLLEAVAVALPKWGRACDWTPTDDAMLLLGIYWCCACLSFLPLLTMHHRARGRGAPCMRRRSMRMRAGMTGGAMRGYTPAVPRRVCWLEHHVRVCLTEQDASQRTWCHGSHRSMHFA